MKLKKRGVLSILLIIIILLLTFIVLVNGDDEPPIVLTGSSLNPETQTTVNTQLSTSGGLSLPVDSSYLNANLNPSLTAPPLFTGTVPPQTRVDGGRVIFPDGTVVDPSTYNGPKPISIVDGKVSINNGGFSNTQGLSGEGDTVKASDVGNFENSLASLSINNARNFEYSPNRVLVEYAENINLLNSKYDKTYYFFYDMGQKVKLDSAEKVTIEDMEFNNINNASFTISANKLIDMIFTSSENETYSLKSPFPTLFSNMKLSAEPNCRIELNYSRTDSANKKYSELSIPTCAKLDLYNDEQGNRMTFTATNNTGYLKLTEDGRYMIRNGNLTFKSINHTETLQGIAIADADLSKGFTNLILSGFMSIAPGGRYTYEDSNKAKSFSLFNHGQEDFEIGISRGDLDLSTYRMDKNRNFGYIDFTTDFMEYNGIITYEKYASIPFTPELSELQFRQVYTQNDIKNKADFTATPNGQSFLLKNPTPENDSIATVRYGYNEFYEKKGKRFLYITDAPGPYSLSTYKFDNFPEFTFRERTAYCANTDVHNMVSDLSPKSSALMALETSITSQISYFNEQYRAFHQYLLNRVTP